MTRIAHVALWTEDIDRCMRFYIDYLGASACSRYEHREIGFSSCFLDFADGARLEVMATTTLSPVRAEPGAQRMGLTHFAISLGSERAVDDLTERLRQDGHPVVEGPRRTGDGCYESVVLDPDGNRVELTV